MHTTTETALRRILATCYGMADPVIAYIRTRIDGNQTFKLISDGTPLIARVYGEQGRLHPDHVRYELELLAHLARSSISVAAPPERPLITLPHRLPHCYQQFHRSAVHGAQSMPICTRATVTSMRTAMATG